MPTRGEHKTVQARILAYAEAIGWTIVFREEAERRRGIAAMTNGECRMTNASLFFDDLLRGRRGVARAVVALAVQPRG
jgi:type I restriction enzyme R subunit